MAETSTLAAIETVDITAPVAAPSKEVHPSLAAIIQKVKSQDEKCGVDGYWLPYGGAMSFDEVDAFYATAELESLTYTFQGIIGNILSSDDLDLSARADAVISATQELKSRLTAKVSGLNSGTTGDADMSDMNTGEMARKTGLMGRIKNAFVKPPVIAPVATPEESEHTKPTSSFVTFKDARGDWRWFGIFSSTDWDRDVSDTAPNGERFPSHVWKSWIEKVDRTKEYPELRIWHVKGSKIGTVDWVDITSEELVVASGTYDKGMEAVAANLKSLGLLGMSHGFRYSESLYKDGVYGDVDTFEVSVLPYEFVANADTAYLALPQGHPEEDKMFDPKKKSFLAEVFSGTLADGLEDILAKAKDTEASAVYKDIVAVSDGVVAGTTEETPATTETTETTAEVVVDTTPDVSATTAELTDALRNQIGEIVGAAITPLLEAVTSMQATQNQAMEAASAVSKAMLSQSDEIKELKSQLSLNVPRNMSGVAAFSATQDASTRANGNARDVKDFREALAPDESDNPIGEHLKMFSNAFPVAPVAR